MSGKKAGLSSFACRGSSVIFFLLSRLCAFHRIIQKSFFFSVLLELNVVLGSGCILQMYESDI